MCVCVEGVWKVCVCVVCMGVSECVCVIVDYVLYILCFSSCFYIQCTCHTVYMPTSPTLSLFSAVLPMIMNNPPYTPRVWGPKTTVRQLSGEMPSLALRFSK